MVVRCQSTIGPHAASNSAFLAGLRYQYHACLASTVNRAKMPSRGALMFAQFVGELPLTAVSILFETELGVVESKIAPSAENFRPWHNAGIGVRRAWNRAVAA